MISSKYRQRNRRARRFGALERRQRDVKRWSANPDAKEKLERALSDVANLKRKLGVE